MYEFQAIRARTTHRYLSLSIVVPFSFLFGHFSSKQQKKIRA